MTELKSLYFDVEIEARFEDGSLFTVTVSGDKITHAHRTPQNIWEKGDSEFVSLDERDQKLGKLFVKLLKEKEA